MKIEKNIEDQKILDSMRDVLSIEIQGLKLLKQYLDEKFIQLVKICKSCEGKIILTGMGKSGHVAKKISATMASLGSPSFYLHPAEAAHGDLGMIQREDVIIMISKSGETVELLQLMNSVKIIGCNLVGIFCRKESTLSKYCNFTVIIPIEKEACANNLAPTTSTTVAMALGDALAVTLSKIKKFGEMEFALFHPEGALGKRLLITAGILNRVDVVEISVKEENSIESVLWVITKNHFGAAVVIDDNKRIVGLVTDGDIRREMEKNGNALKKKVKEIMTIRPSYVSMSMLAIDVFQIMRKKKISVVPIVDENHSLCGMISIHDIIGAGIIA